MKIKMENIFNLEHAIIRILYKTHYLTLFERDRTAFLLHIITDNRFYSFVFVARPKEAREFPDLKLPTQAD